MSFIYQISQTKLNLQVALMMEEEEKQKQSQEIDSSSLQENSQEMSQSGPSLPVSVKEKARHFKCIFQICFVL